MSEREEREQFAKTLHASMESAAARAPSLKCFGLVTRDPAGQLYCWNWAHKGFAEAIYCRQDERIAFCGVNVDGAFYADSLGEKTLVADVRAALAAELCEDPPSGETLVVAYLSRSEAVRRVPWGKAMPPAEIAELCKLPEYVARFNLRFSPDKDPYNSRVSWDEPAPNPS